MNLYKGVSGPHFEEAPWLLLFARGELIFSENPHAPRSDGGLGFAARLRRCSVSCSVVDLKDDIYLVAHPT